MRSNGDMVFSFWKANSGKYLDHLSVDVYRPSIDDHRPFIDVYRPCIDV